MGDIGDRDQTTRTVAKIFIVYFHSRRSRVGADQGHAQNNEADKASEHFWQPKCDVEGESNHCDCRQNWDQGGGKRPGPIAGLGLFPPIQKMRAAY